jgi:transposase-like protein
MPHNKKLGTAEKIEIIRDQLAGKYSIEEAAQRAGVSRSTIQRWKMVYEAEGVEGFIRQRNRAYSAAEKRTAVEEYLRGGSSIQVICKKYKISDSHVFRRWLKVYNAHGDFNSVKHSGGGSYMKQGRDTTKEERLEIVKDCLACGKNYGEMALKHKVSYQQVRTWTLRFEEIGEAGLEDRRGKRKKDQEPRTELEAAQIEIERLKHQLYLAEMERDLLKKLDEIERRDASHK